MNKQEAVKCIKNKEILVLTTSYEDKRYNEGLITALSYIEQIDEPEKPVVPQFVADWYEGHKRSLEWNLRHLGLDMMNGVFDDTEMKGWLNDSKNKPFETLVKMKLYGYEVEGEKLYTVKFANEDFGTIYIGIFKKANKIGLSTLPMNNEYSKCYFTESELKELKFWDNPAFEVKEVKE